MLDLAKVPFFPKSDAPLQDTWFGVIIHECAYLFSKGEIGDKAYGVFSLLLDPFAALENASNYEIAVQATLFGLSATEAASRR
jgi:hypothetical protein